MGLFDKFLGAAKEIAEGTKTALENIEKEMNQEVNNTKSMDEERYKNPPESFPVVPVQAKLHGHNVQFMISGDFIEHEGYIGSVISLKYEPEHLGVLEMDDENEITVSLLEGVGEFDEIADCIDEYISSGTLDTEGFEVYTDGKYLFKAKVAASHSMYFYVLRSDSDDPYEYDILLLIYPAEVEGTDLEKKMMACFDDTAKTLTILV